MVHPLRVKAIASARVEERVAWVDSKMLAHLSVLASAGAWMGDEQTQQAER